MFELNQKTAVITGAASGIGRAIANAFAASGAIVWLLDCDATAGITAAEEIPNAQFAHVDVGDTDSVADVARSILDRNQGRIDLLVNSAGVGYVGDVLTTEVQDFDRLFQVNVRGVMLMTRALLPAMLNKSSGSIINIASVGGVVGLPNRFAYCATKFAVIGMTKALAVDYAASGVRFNAICPGRVETPFTTARDAETSKPGNDINTTRMGSRSVRLAQPSEVAAAAVYLASDQAAFVNGSSLIIDGGVSAGK